MCNKDLSARDLNTRWMDKLRILPFINYQFGITTDTSSFQPEQSTLFRHKGSRYGVHAFWSALLAGTKVFIWINSWEFKTGRNVWERANRSPPALSKNINVLTFNEENSTTSKQLSEYGILKSKIKHNCLGTLRLVQIKVIKLKLATPYIDLGSEITWWGLDTPGRIWQEFRPHRRDEAHSQHRYSGQMQKEFRR